MPQSTQHVLQTTFEQAAARMPAHVRVGAADVEVTAEPEPSLWRWASGDSSGKVGVARLSPTTTCLEVTAVGAHGGQVAERVAEALRRVLEPGWVPPAPARRIGPSPVRRAAVAVAVILIPLLAFGGIRILAPPAPLDVTAAVSQFGQQQSAGRTTFEPDEVTRAQDDAPERRRRRAVARPSCRARSSPANCTSS